MKESAHTVILTQSSMQWIQLYIICRGRMGLFEYLLAALE